METQSLFLLTPGPLEVPTEARDSRGGRDLGRHAGECKVTEHGEKNRSAPQLNKQLAVGEAVEVVLDAAVV